MLPRARIVWLGVHQLIRIYIEPESRVISLYGNVSQKEYEWVRSAAQVHKMNGSIVPEQPTSWHIYAPVFQHEVAPLMTLNTDDEQSDDEAPFEGISAAPAPAPPVVVPTEPIA